MNIATLLRRVHLRSRQSDPYDFVITGAGRPLHVKVKSPNGRYGIMFRKEQHDRLARLGHAAVWALGTLVPLRALVGVAHVHRHRLNPVIKTVAFRIVGGRPVPPRWCFGPCEGPLKDASSHSRGSKYRYSKPHSDAKPN